MPDGVLSSGAANKTMITISLLPPLLYSFSFINYAPTTFAITLTMFFFFF